MAKKNFIMLELEDDKTKEIANVVSNKSCRKILDSLAEKESTESEIAKELGLPISTVHYNLQQLMKTGLVSADEYHYSKKGKEVLHYKLANKYIIITPKKVTGLTQKLRSILPVAFISAGVAGMIEIYLRFFSGKEKLMTGADELAARSADSAPMFAMQAEEAAAETLKVAPEALETSQRLPIIQDIALWFLLGALFALGIYALILYLRREKQ